MAKKVLIIDDEKDMRVYLEALFRKEGFETASAENGDEGLWLAEANRPDLITLDILMPKKSGIAFYQEYKLDDSFKDIPAIFISAFSLARDFHSRSFRKLIPDERVPEPAAYIEKPVKVDKLLEVIEHTIG